MTAAARRVERIYVVRMFLIALLYVGLVWLRRRYLHAEIAPGLHAAIIAAPVLPIWLMLVAVWRYYAGIDEFAQRRLLQILAVAFGLSACTIVSYAFLEDLGLPQVHLLTAWPVMALFWVALTFLAKWRDRIGRDEK
jgi:hypothetical protein